MDYKEFDKKPEKRTYSEVFFEAVSKKWKSLFVLGFLLALSLVPVITFRFLLVLHEGEMNLAVQSENLTTVDAFNSVNSLTNMFYIASFLLIIPAAVVMAGIMKVAKFLSWREKVPVKDSFGEGMKENSIFTVILAIINVAILWCVNFVSRATAENLTWKYLPFAVYLLVLLPSFMWSLAACAIYKGSFASTLTNGFILAVKTYPLTVVMMIIIFLPLIFLLLSSVYAQLIVPFIFALYLPFAWLLWVLFTNHFFDKHININQFPELIDKGLN